MIFLLLGSCVWGLHLYALGSSHGCKCGGPSERKTAASSECCSQACSCGKSVWDTKPAVSDVELSSIEVIQLFNLISMAFLSSFSYAHTHLARTRQASTPTLSRQDR